MFLTTTITCPSHDYHVYLSKSTTTTTTTTCTRAIQILAILLFCHHHYCHTPFRYVETCLFCSLPVTHTVLCHEWLQHFFLLLKCSLSKSLTSLQSMNVCLTPVDQKQQPSVCSLPQAEVELYSLSLSFPLLATVQRSKVKQNTFELLLRSRTYYPSTSRRHTIIYYRGQLPLTA